MTQQRENRMESQQPDSELLEELGLQLKETMKELKAYKRNQPKVTNGYDWARISQGVIIALLVGAIFATLNLNTRMAVLEARYQNHITVTHPGN